MKRMRLYEEVANDVFVRIVWGVFFAFTKRKRFGMREGQESALAALVVFCCFPFSFIA